MVRERGSLIREGINDMTTPSDESEIDKKAQQAREWVT